MSARSNGFFSGSATPVASRYGLPQIAGKTGIGLRKRPYTHQMANQLRPAKPGQQNASACVAHVGGRPGRTRFLPGRARLAAR